MDKTPNYNLGKPLATEMYDIGVFNANADAIDSALKALDDRDGLLATKASLSEHVNNKLNPHEVTKAQVGLGNVDDTQDMDKPVSALQALAINDALNSALGYTNAEIATLKGTATEAADTLGKIEETLNSHAAQIADRYTKAEADEKHTELQTELQGYADEKDNALKAEIEEEVNDRYTKTEVDNKISEVLNNLDWKETVATFDELETTYPEPQDGWTVNVADTDITYRYDGENWVPISTNAIPKATDEVDGLLSKEDHQKYEAAAAIGIMTPEKAGFGKPDDKTVKVDETGTLSVPVATAEAVGVVKPDGKTVNVDGDGALSVPAATIEAAGIVKPDGTTVTVGEAGTLSVAVSTADSAGIMKPDGKTVKVDDAGILSASVATSEAAGIVQPDDKTVKVDETGVLSVPVATAEAAGIVKPDGTSVTVADGGVLSVAATPTKVLQSSSESLSSTVLLNENEHIIYFSFVVGDKEKTRDTINLVFPYDSETSPYVDYFKDGKLLYSELIYTDRRSGIILGGEEPTSAPLHQTWIA